MKDDDGKARDEQSTMLVQFDFAFLYASFASFAVKPNTITAKSAKEAQRNR